MGRRAPHTNMAIMIGNIFKRANTVILKNSPLLHPSTRNRTQIQEVETREESEYPMKNGKQTLHTADLVPAIMKTYVESKF